MYLKLEQCFKKFDIHYYLIGANARDVQLYKSGSKPNRGTADIDFAVMLPDMDTYHALMAELNNMQFQTAYGNLPYRLYYKASNSVIDILPYGQIAQDKTVKFTDRAIELSVLGMDGVGQAIEEFEHPEGFSIPVSPLHGMVLLKLVAWSERPEKRVKDLLDIKVLIDGAWNIYEDELYTENSPYADLFDVENFDTQITAARVLGRKMKEILALDIQLNQTVRSVLENELNADVGPIAKQLVGNGYETAEDVKAIVEAINSGIND